MLLRGVRWMIALLAVGLMGCHPSAEDEKAKQQAHQQYQVVFYDTASMSLVSSIAFPKSVAEHADKTIVTSGQMVAPELFGTDTPVNVLLQIQGSTAHTPGQHLMISATPCENVTRSTSADGKRVLHCEHPLDDTRPTEITIRDHTLPLPVAMAYGLTAAISDGG
ncbi:MULTISPECIES: hypothetical protein [Zymobacter]|uniref:Permeases of the major facilitator n=1 Tax=Zymobacter palmae TaxID=33074 RepID=A0A348HD87_9GAMM|nr:hypothetical protein [Zymobacter palmae]BBG29589.1 permeases of the major facilitator [Zymobacter palmae]